MAELWPVSLPHCFLTSSYAEGLGDGRLKTAMDAGPAKMRRRSSAVPGSLSGQLMLDGTQLNTLITFVKTTTLSGSLAFTFPSQRAGTAMLCRFADNLPTWQRAATGKYLVNLQFEILP